MKKRSFNEYHYVIYKLNMKLVRLTVKREKINKELLRLEAKIAQMERRQEAAYREETN